MKGNTVYRFRMPDGSLAIVPDAGGRDGAGVERVEAGGVDRMSESEIVSVKYEELCVGRIAETLGDFVGLGGEVQDEEAAILRLNAGISA